MKWKDKKMIEAIYKRRSVRHFLQKPVPEEDLDQILEAGMWAPSEKNAQPWKFLVVRGVERKSMVKALKEGIMKNRKGEEGALFGKKYERVLGTLAYVIIKMVWRFCFYKNSLEFIKKSNCQQSKECCQGWLYVDDESYGLMAWFYFILYFVWYLSRYCISFDRYIFKIKSLQKTYKDASL